MNSPAELVELEIGAVAHGGHCVARTADAVWFVRGTAPGERVRARETKSVQSGRVRFADTVEVIKASEHRVTPPCEYAGICGGCDFQHIDYEYQTELKTFVLREQLVRTAKLPADHPALSACVEPLGDSLRWRTRVTMHTNAAGKPGFRAANSHDVVPVRDCLVAVDGLLTDGVVNIPQSPNSELRAVLPTASPKVVVAEAAADMEVVERVGEVDFRLSARGFWQAHKDAPARFTKEVLALLKPQPGWHVVELYAGVGLFTLPISEAVGVGGRVDAVEGDVNAARYLRRNSKRFPQVNPVTADAKDFLGQVRRCDALVLDPPRSGAGKQVVERLVKLAPAVVVYVACDPAAFARDTLQLREAGYELTDLRALDAFPMTHHFESFARFERR